MNSHFLAFDWKGFMAHFRQFDANSSALSYSFPPPTVVAGMLAGVLGIEKDEYYERFNRSNLQIAVQIVTPPRKLVQTLNYIFAKSANDLNMSGDNLHTQIPAELLVAPSFPRAPLHYRIFIKIAEAALAGELEEALRQSKFRYLPYLGSAPFTSWIEWLGVPETIEPAASTEPVIVDTVAPLPALELRSLRMEPLDGILPAFFREHVRRDFLPGREPGEVIDVVWEKNRGKIQAQFKAPVYRLRLGQQVCHVVFM
ncbi:MAG: type I-B CRISPR-associated protein Cas5b [candidate division KSB1 bacterium]|nr:type I-B CRISPR-associated protein Cas5b [candidate division KSB1 bacterium]MDZ7274610.1 type I-B CRISPR-associated protein Cas5b [candidate division KSB1 bacterium]MDZ7285435.1 type I-B CRISPR-associated protein Cas5b [candidate division KSB1 bacterium]MDZ7298467.1 type I-B CRISPR-associated protein Cas5b [candidate division KSB1 bacterium]MDZ7306951.1 type I-B CRISPR-associated protein Cas5b [candidate division KSB1 bacterium]